MSVFVTVRVPLGSVLSVHPDTSVAIERVVPTGQQSRHVWLVGERRDRLVETLREDPSLPDPLVLDELSDRTLVRLDGADLSSPLVEALEASEATLAKLRGTNEGWTLQLRVPDADALGRFHDACEDRGVSVELVEAGQDDRAGEDLFGATPTQAETLALALEAGYFDVPRGISLSELAELLGVSDQAASERLRRGLAALLEARVFEDSPDDDSD